MNANPVEEKAPQTDFQLVGGCALCGGTLAVRLSLVGARSCCLSCGWFSSPQIASGRNGIEVMHPTAMMA